jgi:hypothetical protein
MPRSHRTDGACSRTRTATYPPLSWTWCRWLYTGGEDVLGRPWRVSQGADQEPSTATNANGAITALAASVRPAIHSSSPSHC